MFKKKVLPCHPIVYGNRHLNRLSYAVTSFFIMPAKELILGLSGFKSVNLFMCVLGIIIVSKGHNAQYGTNATQCSFSTIILS